MGVLTNNTHNFNRINYNIIWYRVFNFIAVNIIPRCSNSVSLGEFLTIKASRAWQCHALGRNGHLAGSFRVPLNAVKCRNQNVEAFQVRLLSALYCRSATLFVTNKHSCSACHSCLLFYSAFVAVAAMYHVVFQSGVRTVSTSAFFNLFCERF